VVVVVGSPYLLAGSLPPGRRVGGTAVAIARAVVDGGARVELVGKVGDDPAGDDLAVELERASIGHAALLRDPAGATAVSDAGPAPGLSAPDVDLALRYLADWRVIVVADPLDDDVGEAIARSAAFAGAHRVVVDGHDGVENEVTYLRSGPGDHLAFAALVGRYAAHLDAGRDPGDAFAQASAEVGWRAAPDA
jgi:hypothetical protein